MPNKQIEQDWPNAIPDSRVRWRVADPTSPSTEVFDSGTEWWAEEVNKYVRRGRWRIPGQRNYEFGLDGESVGFSFILPGEEIAHPNADSVERAFYHIILIAGVNVGYQGDRGPKLDERVSTSIFRMIEALPRDLVDDDGRPVGRVVGLMLHVRADNVPARKFYAKRGFIDDPGSPFDDKGRPPRPGPRAAAAGPPTLGVPIFPVGRPGRGGRGGGPPPLCDPRDQRSSSANGSRRLRRATKVSGAGRRFASAASTLASRSSYTSLTGSSQWPPSP